MAWRGARWAGGGRYYRGGGYYRGGYGWGAAGLATGAAAAYGSSCYRTQNVWNGYSYVPQTVNVC
jgi:hypothetical protein